MTRTYNIHQAKTQLSKLLAQVAKGDEVFIANAGKTVAKLVPATEPLKKPRQLGTARGMGSVPDNFNAPDPEIEDLFYNGPIFPEVRKPPKRGKSRS